MRFDKEECIVEAMRQDAFILCEKYEEVLRAIFLQQIPKKKAKIILRINHNDDLHNPETIRCLRKIKVDCADVEA